MYTYDTVSEAVNDLVKRGYTHNFSNCEGGIICSALGVKLSPKDFKITEIHRFEGNTDPADEAVVYGIESFEGVKGVLVNGYGISSDSVVDAMVKNL